MSAVETRTVTLSAEQAGHVDYMVAEGRYASASEVVQAGLEALQEFDGDIEHWLRTEVVPACDVIRADPSRGIPADEVFAALRARYEERAESERCA